MPGNDTPVTIALDVPERALELRFRADEYTKERDGRYDWSLEVAVKKGRIRQRTAEFEFTAPEDGYQASCLTEMPRTLKRSDWHDDDERAYWLSFDDGTFGTVKVRMIAGGARYSIVSGYVNPQKGSRNLTVNPANRR